MINRYVGDAPSKVIAVGDHAAFIELLPEYVMQLVLGQHVPSSWRLFEEHLQQCPLCRSEMHALQQSMTAYYAGSIETAVLPQAMNIDFLRKQLPAKAEPVVLDQKVQRSPFNIQLSPQWLLRLALRSSSRAEGPHLRYSFEVPPSSAQAPTVTVEVFSQGDAADRGMVRICVEYPDRGPFDQAGISIRLHAGDHVFSAVSDQNGNVSFTQVPLAEIENWRISTSD